MTTQRTIEVVSRGEAFGLVEQAIRCPCGQLHVLGASRALLTRFPEGVPMPFPCGRLYVASASGVVEAGNG